LIEINHLQIPAIEEWNSLYARIMARSSNAFLRIVAIMESLGTAARLFMFASFTRHPKSVGETYGEHMGVAWSFGFTLIGAGLACLVHGLLPFAFERTGSNTVRRLNDRLSRRCAMAQKTAPAIDGEPVAG
jgi:hypothetical protein